MACQNRQELKRLTEWFVARLDQADIQFGDEPMSYESNTGYDVQFYRLQKEAAAYWARHYGEVPTPGTLMQAFFNAEYERNARSRLATAGFAVVLRGKLIALRKGLNRLTGIFENARSAKNTKREF